MKATDRWIWAVTPNGTLHIYPAFVSTEYPETTNCGRRWQSGWRGTYIIRDGWPIKVCKQCRAAVWMRYVAESVDELVGHAHARRTDVA